MKAWKHSASLILLTKELVSTAKTAPRNDVRVLVQKRSSKSKAFPDAMVFPGGVAEEFDRSNQWIEHFQSFGFGHEHYQRFQQPNMPLHHITLDGEESIQRHITLRITAIRETFEELGILICKPRNTHQDDSNPWASFIADFDVEQWQHKVSADPINFLKLCQMLDCYPDIWSLYLWSNWLTPIKLMQTPRFNTLFFIAAFQKKPSINIQKKEVSSTIWADAGEVLEDYKQSKVNLIFPQWYELTRLKPQKNVSDLIHYAKRRSSYGCDLFYPILQGATDGIAMVLPGDEVYPSEPDYIMGGLNGDAVKTLEELQSETRVCHRGELCDGKMNYYLKNFVPRHNHLSVANDNIPEIAVNIKSSL